MAKYNPYNDYKKIVGYKGDWHNAQSFGQDPNQYYQAAMPYYQSLVDNGYNTLADDLMKSDYTQSKGLRDKYGLKPDEQFNLDNDYVDMTGAGQAATPNAGNRSAYSGIDFTANDSSINKLLDQVTNGSYMMNNTYQTAQGIATGSTPIQPSAATQGLLDAYNNDYNRLNGQIQYDANGNVISGLNTEHYNIGRNQLDYLNNFDVTKQPYYQGIMDAYKLGGYNAAQGEYANGAANNGGNIDSYAAANANRQQLAFTTAGMQQAMAMANQNQQNWQNLYSQMSNDLYNQGTLSLATLGVARDMYAQDSQERMNALDVEGSLASAQMAAAVQQFQSLVEERMKDKGITAEMAMQEKDIAAAKEQLELQLASNERIQEGINATNRYTSDNDLAGTYNTNATNLRMNENDNYTSRSNNAANNATDQYKAKLGYDSDIAGYQNMLDRIAAQSTADQTQAAYDAQIKRDYEQWVMDQAKSNGWVPTGYTENSYTKSLYDTSGNSGTQTDDTTIKPEDVAKEIYTAVSKGETRDMILLGLDRVTSVQGLRDLLLTPVDQGGFGLSDLNDVNKVIKLLKDSGLGDDELYTTLNHYFPGIMTNTSWGGSQNTNTSSVAQ